MTRSTKYFSIIIPVYNIEKYLSKCIESVLQQSFSDYEAILVDDGSTDGCPTVCDRYAEKDSHIKVIHKENGGLVSARKAGLQHSSGKYILNLDGDDYIAPTLLEDLHRIIMEYDPDIVTFGCIQIYSDGSETVSPSPLEEGLYTGAALLELKQHLLCDRATPTMNFGNIVPSVCMKAFRRALLFPHQMAVPESITNGEDAAVSIPAVCNCRALYGSCICGYYYVQHNTSMINTFRRNELEKYALLRSYLVDRVPGIPQDNMDAYFFNLVVNHLSQAARAFPNCSGFLRYINDTVLPNMGSVIRSCHPWPMDNKSRLRFFMIQHQCFRLLWLYYRLK